ncbi:hypothetical protein BHE74_00009464 [Ensete ventricosum]|nr:hypothetical protein BHE74_00009464 [Ensete ventricosum]
MPGGYQHTLFLQGGYQHTVHDRNRNDKGKLEEKTTWSRVGSQTHVTWALTKVCHGWGRWVITGEDDPGVSRGATSGETQRREVRWRHRPGQSPLVAAWWAGKGPRQMPAARCLRGEQSLSLEASRAQQCGGRGGRCFAGKRSGNCVADFFSRGRVRGRYASGKSNGARLFVTGSYYT